MEKNFSATFLHKWKRSWVVLYTDGRVAYFDDPNSHTAEDVINIPRERAIVLGPEYVCLNLALINLLLAEKQLLIVFSLYQCAKVSPPETKSTDLLFAVKTEYKNWHLCADDKDDLM